MSTIGAVGGAGSAWPGLSSSRASAMKERMFAKVDSDGSGSVDKTELQGLLDKMAQKTGQSPGTAEDLLGKMDGNGDGSLSKDELEAGMKSLMPAPSSTVAFAQQRAGGGQSVGDGADAFSALDTDGDGSISKAEFEAGRSKGAEGQGGPGGPGGPPPGGGGPPPSGGATSGSSSSSSTSGSTDPLDTDGDGVVSAQERAAGELKDLMKTLAAAVDSDGDKHVSKSEAEAFTTKLDTALSALQSGQAADGSSGSSSGDGASSSSKQRQLDLALLTRMVLKEYSLAGSNQAQSASTLSLTA